MTSRDQLDSLLDQLEGALPTLIEEHPHVNSFWSAFARAADVVEELASAENWDHVQARIRRMLKNVGMIAGDEAESLD
jgi:hypothetical protein